jgi:hypothetical protein
MHGVVASRLVDETEAAIEPFADRLIGNFERVVEQSPDRHAAPPR